MKAKNMTRLQLAKATNINHQRVQKALLNDGLKSYELDRIFDLLDINIHLGSITTYELINSTPQNVEEWQRKFIKLQDFEQVYIIKELKKKYKL